MKGIILQKVRDILAQIAQSEDGYNQVMKLAKGALMQGSGSFIMRSMEM
jgi:hypothetical protein